MYWLSVLLSVMLMHLGIRDEVASVYGVLGVNI